MLRTIALASLALAISTAAWAGPGTDFCNAMQQNYLACGDEAMKTNSNGQFISECPDTIKAMAIVSEQSIKQSTSALGSEIKNAETMWRGFADHIARGYGETSQTFADRRLDEGRKILSECDRLQSLD
jgi:hypothetical protein